jgi:hypothetical protein
LSLEKSFFKIDIFTESEKLIALPYLNFSPDTAVNEKPRIKIRGSTLGYIAFT